MKLKTRPLFIAAAISVVIGNNAYAFTETVNVGQTITGETVYDIKDGSQTTNVQTVYGTTEGVTVTGDGYQDAKAGGVINNTVAVDDGNILISGGTSNNATIDATSNILIDAGTVNDTDVSGYMQNQGGTDNNTVIESGGRFQLYNYDSVSNNAIIKNGGTADVGGNAETNGWDISGHVYTYRNMDDTVDPTFNNATINTGGELDLNYGAVANDTIVDGGKLVVQSATDQSLYATINNTQLNSGEVDIGVNGIANDTLVNGGVFNVNTGGQSNRTTVNTGGSMFVSGTDNNTIIKNGASYTIEGTTDSTAVSNNAIIENGASVDVMNDSELNGWDISGYVDTSYRSDRDMNATINNATVETGGVVDLEWGAQLNSSIINGGLVRVSTPLNYSGSTTATGTTINAGAMLLTDRGIANNTVVNGGELLNESGNDSDTVVNSNGYYYLGDDNTTDSQYAPASDSLTVNVGGTAVLNVGTATDITNSGTTFINNGVAVAGSLITATGGTTTIQQGSDVSGARQEIDGDVYLDDEATDDTASYQFADVSMNEGAVHYDTDAGFTTLTMTSLSGSGDFYMNTNLAGNNGDELVVTGEATGNFGVYVADTGVSPTDPDALKIIDTGGGGANFTLKNQGGVVDVGTYEYTLDSDGNGDWSLTPEDTTPPTPPDPDDGGDTPTPPAPPAPVTPTITPATAAVLNMATVDPLIFEAELGSVRHRLSEVRSFSHDTNVWGDVYNTRNNVLDDAGAGFHQYLSGMTIGADKSSRSGTGVVTRGGFISYSHSDLDFDRGGNGNVDSYSVGAYASYIHDSGFYLDGILKANRFENDVNGRMTGGGAADGYYDTNGVGAHLQGGKYFHSGDTWVAPYAAVTALTTDNSEYTLSNGMQAHVGNERSVKAETGVNVGHTFTLKNGATLQPYAGAAATQEFINDNHVDVNSDGHFDNDLSGTRGVYQVGLRAQLTSRLTCHVDAAYAQGANVESPWLASAGVAWSF